MVTRTADYPDQIGTGSASRIHTYADIASYVLMGILTLLFLFPWFWTVSSSLKTPREVFVFPPLWFSRNPTLQNYPEVLEVVPFAQWFLNSVIVVTLSTAGTVLSATCVAYSFARFRWTGRDTIFAITLATMMLPAQVLLIPQYLIFRELGWLNTIKPLWIPSWFGGGAFAIFLIRQFIMSLPREFDEAATIDGAGRFRILVTILMPQMKPVLATIGVISFIGGWNNFMGPLIYLTSPRNFTLALGIRYFDITPASVDGIPQQHLLMAAVTMMTTPVILLFFAAQRYFVQGIVMSGLKG